MSERRNAVSPQLPSNPAVAKTVILLYEVSQRGSFAKSKGDSFATGNIWFAGSLAPCSLRLSLMHGQQLLVKVVIIAVRLR